MKKFVLILVFLTAAGVCIFSALYGTTHPELTVYTERFRELPEAFNGFRILQVSDLHDALLGENNCLLTALARKAAPDIIVITGDFVDSNRLNIERSLAFAGELVKTAPVYYVSGNHEAALPRKKYDALISGLNQLGVTVLSDSAVYLEREESRIQLAGLSDIGFYSKGDMEETAGIMLGRAAFAIDDDAFSVLLSHRPELADTYAKTSADVVLCGHAHGGQFRLPLIGGLYAPGQGFLPEYTKGVYNKNSLRMIVSRGIGNSKFPLRLFNDPELVLLEMRTLN